MFISYGLSHAIFWCCWPYLVSFEVPVDGRIADRFPHESRCCGIDKAIQAKIFGTLARNWKKRALVPYTPQKKKKK